jgi:hypothetical protein
VPQPTAPPRTALKNSSRKESDEVVSMAKQTVFADHSKVFEDY